MVEYRGLTWDHPRGYRALEESAKVWERRGLRIRWDRQPLEGFESRKIDELAARYDLIVIDHPHVGEAAALNNCLAAVEKWFPEKGLLGVCEKAIGPVLASYRYAGQHWALPLDAATQVMAYRADLLNGEKNPPRTWNELCTLAERVPIVLCLAGPHALLTFFSVCVAHGEPPLSRPGFISRETGEAALELMSFFFQRMERGASELNPIGILDELSRTNRIALCPLIYGYVNYATAADAGRRAVQFANAPVASATGRLGSTLGGTGLAVSGRAVRSDELVGYITWLLSEQTQREFIPDFEGQPSLRPAWTDPDVNRRFSHFYEKTAASVEQAWIRPRYPGYIRFQSEGSEIIRAGLRAGSSPSMILRDLELSFNRHHPHDQEI
ncbi:MAG: carbohydrate ABC transporter substrate-binding protein [Verrucomicrobia bacterium]|nr:carbohydrate ABC transporter substrate-binding protein [Verrucomicrobiota bacterium]